MKELTSEKVCLALGYFDSMHLGHRKLISEARDLARDMGVKCAVATFSNNAYKVFNPQEKQVYTYEERCGILEDKCDLVLPMRFDARLKNKTASEFSDALFERYDISAVVCGYDYLFGAGAKGDAEFLAKQAEKRGVFCKIVQKFEVDGERVATTAIKQYLADGKIERANTLLGEPFFVTGTVVKGRGAGHMFDIPTANIKIPSGKLLPACGVYAAYCIVDGEEYRGAVNVGGRPTFGLSKPVTEIMLADFNENIYGKQIRIGFLKYLRPVKKFDTPALLSKQVHADIEASKLC